MWSVRFKNEKCILLVADYAKVHRTVGRHGEPYESASEKPLVVWTVFGTCSFMVHPSCMLMWEFISKDYLQIIIIALQAHFVQEMGRYLGLQNLLSKDIYFAGRVPCQIWNLFRRRFFLKIATRHEKRTSRPSRTSYRPYPTSWWVSSAGVVAERDSCSSHEVNLGRWSGRLLWTSTAFPWVLPRLAAPPCAVALDLVDYDCRNTM